MIELDNIGLEIIMERIRAEKWVWTILAVPSRM
jgi:hypothetical protein